MSEGFDFYCGLLRMYDGFSATPDTGVPRFEYDHSHHGLKELRRRYRLDRVAGDGDALTRSLRLRESTAMCDFNTWEQLERKSLRLLEYAFDNGREAGINCVAGDRPGGGVLGGGLAGASSIHREEHLLSAVSVEERVRLHDR